MADYQLSVNEQQLKIISLALDIFARLESGQLDWCFSMIKWKHRENFTEVKPMLEQIQLLLTGMANGNLGIGNISAQSRAAYDIHQVIRHHLAWKYNPKGGETVSFYQPISYSEEPLPEITSNDRVVRSDNNE